MAGVHLTDVKGDTSIPITDLLITHNYSAKDRAELSVNLRETLQS